MNKDQIIEFYETEIRRQVRESLLNHGNASVLIENDDHQISYFNDEVTFFIGEDEVEDNNRLISMEIDIQDIIQEEKTEVETYFIK